MVKIAPNVLSSVVIFTILTGVVIFRVLYDADRSVGNINGVSRPVVSIGKIEIPISLSYGYSRSAGTIDIAGETISVTPLPVRPPLVMVNWIS